MSPAAKAQAQALRALADRIENEDTPLPAEAIASIVASGDEDAAWLEELRLRAESDDDVSLDEALVLSRP